MYSIGQHDRMAITKKNDCFYAYCDFADVNLYLHSSQVFCTLFSIVSPPVLSYVTSLIFFFQVLVNSNNTAPSIGTIAG